MFRVHSTLLAHLEVGITQVQAAKAIGISYGYLSRIKRRAYFLPAKAQERLAAYYGKSSRELFSRAS